MYAILAYQHALGNQLKRAQEAPSCRPSRALLSSFDYGTLLAGAVEKGRLSRQSMRAAAEDEAVVREDSQGHVVGLLSVASLITLPRPVVIPPRAGARACGRTGVERQRQRHHAQRHGRRLDVGLLHEASCAHSREPVRLPRGGEGVWREKRPGGNRRGKGQRKPKPKAKGQRPKAQEKVEACSPGQRGWVL